MIWESDNAEKGEAFPLLYAIVNAAAIRMALLTMIMKKGNRCEGLPNIIPPFPAGLRHEMFRVCFFLTMTLLNLNLKMLMNTVVDYICKEFVC